MTNKTANEQEKLDKVLDQWDRIWSYSQYYVERLKTVELTLSGLEEVTVVVTEFEMKLASYDSMPSDMDNLRKAHDDLMTLEAEIQEKQVSCISQPPMALLYFHPTTNRKPARLWVSDPQLSSAPQSHVSFLLPLSSANHNQSQVKTNFVFYLTLSLLYEHL